MNLAHWQFRHVRTFGDEIGLIVGDREWTNRELHTQSCQFAAALVHLGVKPGSRVALALNNSAELFIASAGAAMAGATVVVLGDRQSREFAMKIAHCEPAVAVFSAGLTEAARQWSGIRERIVVGGGGRSEFPSLDDVISGHTPLQQPVDQDPDGLVQLCYTSGSTGQPKAVAYAHEGIDRFLRAFEPVFAGTTAPRVTLMGYPPTAFASRLLWLRWVTNYRCVLLPEFEAELALRGIQRHAVEELALLPAMAELLLACPTRHLHDCSSLRLLTLGGAHVPAPLVSGLKEFLGRGRPAAQVPRIAVHYGLTETGGGFATTFEGGDGLVGHIMPGVDVRILKDGGGLAQPGEVGEVLVKAPFAPQGYWRDSTETEKVYRNGFVHTGDLGSFREDGQLCLVGRVRDIIIQGGTNIYPAELLNAIHPIAGVRECAVLGVPDQLLGEKVVVCVVRGGESSPSEEQIRAACRRGVDPRKQPVHVLFFTGFPKTEAGKLDMPRLRETVLLRCSNAADARGATPVLTFRSACELVEWELVRILAEDSGPQSLDLHATFGERGLSSIGAVRLAHALAARLSLEVPATIAYQCPTVEACAAWLVSRTASIQPSASVSAQDEEGREADREVAIIGMGVRLPGDVTTSRELWDLLQDGRETVSSVPAERAQGVRSGRPASFLRNAADFDAAFFRLAAQAAELDPRHRHLLEVCWEALESAGYDPASLSTDRVGLFLGLYGSDRYRTPNPLGAAPGMAAGYLCQFFDIQGPVVTVDTTCSSSLVAVHHSVQSLRKKECDLAIVGGANLLGAWQWIDSGAGAPGLLSSDGRCRAFDQSASGFGQGEGCVLLVLKRLATARASADRVLATIVGTAINHDGRSSSLTAPNPLAQAKVIGLALDDAGLAPNSVQYVEAHGTGTPLGDPIEVEGIARSLASSRHTPLAIGSIKTNIGHLEAAAGAAGLAKVALSLSHRLLPASLHCATPNLHIPWPALSVRVQTQSGSWPNPGEKLVAGVSSFGMSGTNAHVVVSEGPRDPEGVWGAADAEAARERRWLLPISAKSPAALRMAAMRWARYLEKDDMAVTCRDIAYSASCRRAHLPFRLAVPGSSRREWAEKLREYAGDDVQTSGDAPRTHRKLAVVFSGQGSQWSGMARTLMAQEAVFREALTRCADLIDSRAGFNLLEEMSRDEATTRLNETDVTQPALLAMQVALYELWKSWGIEPAAVIGHSAGEIAAACVAGALTLDEAVDLVCRRARCCRSAGIGAMAAVSMSVDEAGELVAREAQLQIAAINGPRSVVLAGPVHTVAGAIAELKKKGVQVHSLPAQHAFHSRQMERSAAGLREALINPAVRPLQMRLVSSMTGEAVDRMDGAYWSEQLVRPVKFFSAMQTLLSEDCTAFLEVSPHPVLLPSMHEIFQRHKGAENAIAVGSLRRGGGGRESLLVSLADLHCAGVSVNWARRYSVRGRYVELPSYSWEHARHWWSEDGDAEQSVTSAPIMTRQNSAPITLTAGELRMELARLTGLPLEQLQEHRTLDELGVDSLGVIRLRSKLALASTLDTAQVRLDRTLGELLVAVTVSQGGVEPRALGSPLQWLRRTGSNPTHIFVHAVGGGIGCYRALARALPFRLIAIESPWLLNEEPPPERLEEIAAAYLTHLERMDLEEPVVLAGWSFGGVTAYEMARQLARKGHRVSRVIMIDSYAGSELPRDIDNLVACAPPTDEVSSQARRRIKRIRQANFAALRAYEPGRYEGDVISARAVPAWGEPDRIWRERAPRLCVHRVEADHFSIMNDDRTSQLARAFA